MREASRWVLSALPGGVCATAQVSAYRCVTLMSASVEISKPRSRAAGAAIEKRAQAKGLFPALGKKRSILRRDPDLARRHDLLASQAMKGQPVERGTKLPCQRALTVIAIPTQVAQRDVPAQGQDGREQNGKELGLRLTNRRQLFEDRFDNCHGDELLSVDLTHPQ